MNLNTNLHSTKESRIISLCSLFQSSGVSTRCDNLESILLSAKPLKICAQPEPDCPYLYFAALEPLGTVEWQLELNRLKGREEGRQEGRK
jgi:hypothetical protein